MLREFRKYTVQDSKLATLEHSHVSEVNSRSTLRWRKCFLRGMIITKPRSTRGLKNERRENGLTRSCASWSQQGDVGFLSSINKKPTNKQIIQYGVILLPCMYSMHRNNTNRLFRVSGDPIMVE